MTTLPTNDDFANCELSIEELEAIAGGWPGWARAIGRGIEKGWDAVISPHGAAVLGLIGAITGIFGSPLSWGQQNQPPGMNLNL
jgi:hypothetical protein